MGRGGKGSSRRPLIEAARTHTVSLSSLFFSPLSPATGGGLPSTFAARGAITRGGGRQEERGGSRCGWVGVRGARACLSHQRRVGCSSSSFFPLLKGERCRAPHPSSHHLSPSPRPLSLSSATLFFFLSKHVGRITKKGLGSLCARSLISLSLLKPQGGTSQSLSRVFSLKRIKKKGGGAGGGRGKGAQKGKGGGFSLSARHYEPNKQTERAHTHTHA